MIRRFYGKVPFLTTGQMIEVDRLMVEEYQIDLTRMMEHAGRNLARLAVDRWPLAERILVLAGRGGNGGGALVAARRLHCWGRDVSIQLCASMDRFKSTPAKQLDICMHLGIPLFLSSNTETAFNNYDLIIDGMIGYSLKGHPRNPISTFIEKSNQSNCFKLALDNPSGLDAGSGQRFDPVFKADATMTLALPKMGLMRPENQSITGEIYLADISVPPQLYAEPTLDLKVSEIFKQSEILRLS